MYNVTKFVWHLMYIIIFIIMYIIIYNCIYRCTVTVFVYIHTENNKYNPYCPVTIIMSAFVHRSTGAYVQILFQVLLRDMIQFGTIFLVFLFSFSGSFYLALRGEELSRSFGVCENATQCDVNTTNETDVVVFVNSSLNLFPFETE